MSLKLENGDYEKTPCGLPRECTALEELLQSAELALKIKQGSFIYDRSIGSALYTLDPTAEHFEEIALAAANEALMKLGGISAVGAEYTDGKIIFEILTPLGEGKIIYDDIRTNA